MKNLIYGGLREGDHRSYGTAVPTHTENFGNFRRCLKIGGIDLTFGEVKFIPKGGGEPDFKNYK